MAREPVRVNDLEVRIFHDTAVRNREWAAATMWTYVGDGSWWATSLAGVEIPRILRARLKADLPIHELPRDGVLFFCDQNMKPRAIRATGAQIT